MITLETSQVTILVVLKFNDYLYKTWQKFLLQLKFLFHVKFLFV